MSLEVSLPWPSCDSGSSKFYFQQNTTMEQYQKKKTLCRYQLIHWNIAASASGHQRTRRAQQAGNQSTMILNILLPYQPFAELQTGGGLLYVKTY